MNITNNYEQHVDATKKLKMADSFYEVREPYKEGFEEIYTKAKEKNITISNAKDFLNSLTKEELSTLQHYTLLVDDINVNEINDEGAYNLLLHHYEKYDFNNDGIVSNGISQGGSLLPKNMPANEKEALVQTLNEMDEKDRFISLLILNPPKLRLLEDGTIQGTDNNEMMDYEAIMERIHRIQNPLPGEYRSQSLLDSFQKFKELFDKNFEAISEQNAQRNANTNNDSHLTKAKMANA